MNGIITPEVVIKPTMTEASIAGARDLHILTLLDDGELEFSENCLISRWATYKEQGKPMSQLVALEEEINSIWREQFKRFKRNKEAK